MGPMQKPATHLLLLEVSGCMPQIHSNNISHGQQKHKTLTISPGSTVVVSHFSSHKYWQTDMVMSKRIVVIMPSRQCITPSRQKLWRDHANTPKHWRDGKNIGVMACSRQKHWCDGVITSILACSRQKQFYRNKSKSI